VVLHRLPGDPLELRLEGLELPGGDLVPGHGLSFRSFEQRYPGHVTTCSLSSFVAGGGGAAYTASKHGLLGFTKQLTYDYAGKGIRANAICPGLIETGMTKPLLDDPESGAHKFVQETPSVTWGQPSDVAKLAAFLASDDAKFIHGAGVMIDGGWTIK
jgi:3-oxoacyl-[acyl-carrier protein] reductase